MREDDNTKIHAVLLVPHEGDPAGLLREGPCGARPPTAPIGRQAWDECDHRFAKCPKSSPCSGLNAEERERCIALGYCRGWPGGRALVLAWGGEVVPHADGWLTASHLVGPCLRAMEATGNLRVFGPLRTVLSDLGTVVLLDADGKEIA